MISGVVHADEGRIRLKVSGSNGQELEIEAIVDSGYTSYLTLPPDVITTLGLSWQTMDTAMLADGSECIFSVYEGSIIWDGTTPDTCGRSRCGTAGRHAASTRL